jgi:hypothetical protein
MIPLKPAKLQAVLNYMVATIYPNANYQLPNLIHSVAE